MLPKTLTILILIGLLLSVGLWGVSYLNCAYCPNSARCLLLSHGAVSLQWLPPFDVDYSEKTHTKEVWSESLPRVWIRTADAPGKLVLMFIPGPWVGGFSGWSTYLTPHFGVTAAFGSVWVPFWIPTIAWGLLFMFYGPSYFHRRKRKKLGLCLKCGYDLRGSRKRCPECGAEFDAAKNA